MHKPPRIREEKLPSHASSSDIKQLEQLGEELKAIQIARDEKYHQLAACLRTVQARQLRLQRIWSLKKEKEQLIQRMKALTAKNEDQAKCHAQGRKRREASVGTVAQAVSLLKAKAEALRSSQAQLQEMIQREQKVSRHLEFLRWRLVGKLKTVFPLSRPVEPESAFKIGGLQLPNSDFTGCDEEEIAAALGFVAHVLALLGKWFDVPLRYPIVFLCSRSLILDEIAHGTSPRFPLFSRGVDRARFEYGVYLLNKNLEQLLQSQGFVALNLKQTLPNLATFMNHQLRPAGPVSALPMSASLSVLPGTSLVSPNSNSPMGGPLVRTFSTTPPNGGSGALPVSVLPRQNDVRRRESPGRRSTPSAMMATYSPPRKVSRPTGVSPGPQPPALHHSHSSSHLSQSMSPHPHPQSQHQPHSRTHAQTPAQQSQTTLHSHSAKLTP